VGGGEGEVVDVGLGEGKQIGSTKQSVGVE
jgi:hypothetical protein